VSKMHIELHIKSKLEIVSFKINIKQLYL